MVEKVKILKVRCPRCGTRGGWEGNPNRPFCSEKCRLIDLGRWAEEDYRIPGERVEPEEPGSGE
ncbi:DNA gyrase inhibitor YacG [Desulfuromonas versatilis]|uniref:DNA gyrase inhibitor YacG n=1 Tax=Desulfuromonas versatilis TaxID=2802975 RepID=A0ABM8HW48_9BACT|nr:DNA gyrase inhibitor YacG [Desulfuromonas versatilis]BCR04976.1 DNA gyrase inhibitor YacG [Desulfuromonas versatilis]